VRIIASVTSLRSLGSLTWLSRCSAGIAIHWSWITKGGFGRLGKGRMGGLDTEMMRICVSFRLLRLLGRLRQSTLVADMLLQLQLQVICICGDLISMNS